MLRRPSATESSTSSSAGDVTFDDVDDGHVFAFLDEGDSSAKPASARTVEFRLDFSSRINPAPLPIAPTSPLSRRSSTTSITSKQSNSPSSISTSTKLQRSPSMKSSLPFRKRLSRHPSEPPPEAVVAAALKAAATVRPESPPSSPPPPLPVTVGPQIVALPAKSPPQPNKPSPPRPSDPPSPMLSSSPAIDALQAENESLRAELLSTRALVADLHARIRAADQQTETLRDHAAALEEECVAQRQTFEQDLADLRSTLQQENATALAEAHDQLSLERTRHQREAEATAHSRQEEMDRHQRLVDHAQSQHRTLEAQCSRLQEALARAQSESREVDQSFAKCESLQATADHWEAQCQSLQEQVHQLLHEQEESRSLEAQREQQQQAHLDKHKATHATFALQVHTLQMQLKALAADTREVVAREMKRAAALLTKVQQHTSELAVQLNHKAMVLAAKQNRIIQLETQLKNERQAVHQLETALAKTTRTLQRKEALFTAKYAEQKEFLDITVAVRNGLSHELQNKRAKTDELEQAVVELARSKEAVERKNRHLAQQVKIMQHMHVRELEQVALGRPPRRQSCGSLPTASSLGLRPLAASSMSTRAGAAAATVGDIREGRLPEDDDFAAEEWREFVELTAAHEAEWDRRERRQRLAGVAISF